MPKKKKKRVLDFLEERAAQWVMELEEREARWRAANPDWMDEWTDEAIQARQDAAAEMFFGMKFSAPPAASHEGEGTHQEVGPEEPPTPETPLPRWRGLKLVR